MKIQTKVKKLMPGRFRPTGRRRGATHVADGCAGASGSPAATRRRPWPAGRSSAGDSLPAFHCSSLRSSVARRAVGGARSPRRVGRQIGLGVAVAFETLAHAHVHDAGHHIHRLDRAVAGLAFDADVHVRAVIEVHVVRQVIDPLPCHRGIRRQPRQHVLVDVVAVGHGDVPMAIHAGLHCGNGREAAAVGIRVAVFARNAIQPRVHAMREGDRLRRRVAEREARGLRGPSDDEHRPDGEYDSNGKYETPEPITWMHQRPPKRSARKSSCALAATSRRLRGEERSIGGRPCEVAYQLIDMSFLDACA